MLGRTNSNEGTEDSGQGRTSSDDSNTEDTGQGWVGSTTFVLINYASVSSPINIPTGTDVAGSHTWLESLWGFGSGAIVGTILISGSGSFIAAGRSFPSAVGSGVLSVFWANSWLGSGFDDAGDGVDWG